MDLTQNRKIRKVVFVDYKPAELKKNKDWVIVYYFRNPTKPTSEPLDRKRVRVPKISSARERDKYAKKMCLEINKKLEQGWCPLLDAKENKELALFSDAQMTFINQIKKQVKDGIKRKDTLRSYTSVLKLISDYIKDKELNTKFCFEFNKVFIVNYLDHIYYEKGNSPRTCNNHLFVIRAFCSFLIERGYLSTNPTKGISKKPKIEKIRQVIPTETRNKIFSYLKDNNTGFLVLSMCTYYCFIRRTELTGLKVKNVNLELGYITIPSSISKNKKTEDVTIPNKLKTLLKKHIGKAKENELLFSNDFNTGYEKLKPLKVTKTWSYMRKKLDIDKIYQFYSLKDTGITELLNSGIPAIKVRDQARHHDLKITESYTSRNKGADNLVQTVNFDF